MMNKKKYISILALLILGTVLYFMKNIIKDEQVHYDNQDQQVHIMKKGKISLGVKNNISKQDSGKINEGEEVFDKVLSNLDFNDEATGEPLNIRAARGYLEYYKKNDPTKVPAIEKELEKLIKWNGDIVFLLPYEIEELSEKEKLDYSLEIQEWAKGKDDLNQYDEYVKYFEYLIDNDLIKYNTNTFRTIYALQHGIYNTKDEVREKFVDAQLKITESASTLKELKLNYNAMGEIDIDNCVEWYNKAMGIDVIIYNNSENIADDNLIIKQRLMIKRNDLSPKEHSREWCKYLNEVDQNSLYYDQSLKPAAEVYLKANPDIEETMIAEYCKANNVTDQSLLNQEQQGEYRKKFKEYKKELIEKIRKSPELLLK